MTRREREWWMERLAAQFDKEKAAMEQARKGKGSAPKRSSGSRRR